MALGREDWLQAALDELVEGGVDAVRVEAVARRLGVTKGSFYWHFQGRRDLLDALLRWYEAVGTQEVIDAVEQRQASPAERLRALAVVALGGSERRDRAELAVRAWASTDPAAAKALRRVDRRRLRYVTDLLEAAGQEPAGARRRAAVFYRLLIGEFVWRSHGGSRLPGPARDEFVDLLLT